MEFDDFMKQLGKTNATLDYFVDFDKVLRNVEDMSIRLHQLNYLIGKEDIAYAVKQLYKQNKNCFSVLKILIAIRDNKDVINSDGQIVKMNDYLENEDKIIEYLNNTGLSEIFKNKNIKNLVDYVFGVEVGLDSNSRKNRGGNSMEKLVASIFIEHGIVFKSEVKSSNFPILKTLGKDEKRFDFMIETKERKYLIEVNYYNTGGSKLNETARSYTDIAPKINQYDNFEFVWITDGQGWYKAKNKLHEAFNAIPKIYNLTSISDFIETIKRESQ